MIFHQKPIGNWPVTSGNGSVNLVIYGTLGRVFLSKIRPKSASCGNKVSTYLQTLGWTIFLPFFFFFFPNTGIPWQLAPDFFLSLELENLTANRSRIRVFKLGVKTVDNNILSLLEKNRYEYLIFEYPC